jgi:hypothetical protein
MLGYSSNAPEGTPVDYGTTPYHLWEPDVLTIIPFGEVGIRFVGSISAIPNYQIAKTLSTELTSTEYKLISAIGTWVMDTDTNSESMLTGGSSNIHGLHSFGNISLSKDGVIFESLSTGDRMNAEYDIFLRLKRR